MILMGMWLKPFVVQQSCLSSVAQKPYPEVDLRVVLLLVWRADPTDPPNSIYWLVGSCITTNY